MKDTYKALEVENYLYLDCSEELCLHMKKLLVLAQQFFDQDQLVKDKFSFLNTPSGYRNIGVEYAQNSDSPDLNESFTFRKIERDMLLSHTEISEFTQELSLVQSLLDDIAQNILDDVAHSLGKTNDLSTDMYGWLQINYYQPCKQKRTFLMDEHEDGTLLTLLTTDQKGLEFRTFDNRSGVIDGNMNKQLVIPSEVLTLLTGNKIKPLYHRVRNHPEIYKRFSIIYFVVANERNHISPWVENEFNQGVDIAKRLIENALRYGLPT